ncbi:hypothetical protein EX895_001526 [Sporisorium graminicola]|uniref:FAD/NAD(P)-binding domain-containing protein n=1 Tax=Sporisorium graminicola TaxID=280036 RepID=A0A4U7KY37_9BASI|nr:hypothetical protein EX895_001526 [Sporisorium graminicola]TKY89741.1 hypothetical protein EX895_001526 [Sporisorium graminicola]
MATNLKANPSFEAEKADIVDVLIVGGGISGINAACRLTDSLPNTSYTILEGRQSFGGTWDFFKYPGIRSDSDLHTFGYAFKAWRGPAIACAPEILKYLNEVAQQYDLPSRTHFNTKVQQASWSSQDKLWTIKAVVSLTGESRVYRARFYLNCCGYYDYDQPLDAEIPGIDGFTGTVVHPQFWKLTEQDFKDKRVAVIGSGATAITLLPALAGKTKHVTLVQRSPSYVVAISPNDPIANLVQKTLPERLASFVIRQKNVARIYAFYHFARTFPRLTRGLITVGAARLLPKDTPVEPHFTPKYAPWDQRVCLSPDGDFFKAFRDGHASVATGIIKTIEENQIMLDTGDKIHADIIVTATGLKLQSGGGVRVIVDGEEVHINQKFVWRGCMIEDVPNYAFVMGYTNASWTLGADCTAHAVVRLLSHLAETNQKVVRPEMSDLNQVVEESIMDMSSTYVAKGRSSLPKVATTGPWKRRTNYWIDMWTAKHATFDQLNFA